MKNYSLPKRKSLNYRFFILAGILLAGTILRFFHLSILDVGNDEIYNIVISSLSLPKIYYAVSKEIHPSLWYYILHFWMYFGKNLIILRTLSVLFGILSIPLFYFLGKKFYGEKVGILSALFLSLSPFHIYYSQEIRMYSSGLFLAGLQLWIFLRILESNNKYNIAGFIILTALSFYNHYSSFYILFGETVFLLIMWTQKRYLELIRSWIISLFIIFILYLPGTYILFCQTIMVHKFGSKELIENVYPMPDLKIIPTTFYNLIFWGYFNMQVKILFIILIIILFFCGLRTGIKDKLQKGNLNMTNKEKTIFLSLYLFPPFFISFILGKLLYSPLMYSPRFFIIFIPAYYFIISNGLNNIKSNFIRIISLTLFFGTLLFCSISLNNGLHKFSRPPTKVTIEYIKANYQNNDLVMIHFGYYKMLFEYYNKWNINIGSVLDSFDPMIGAWPLHHEKVDETYLPKFKKELKGSSRLWLVLTPKINAQWRDPKNIILRYCENNFNRIGHKVFKHGGENEGFFTYEVYLYDLKSKK